jgi:hypothetical protein
MCKLYGAPELLNFHCKNNCPVGEIYFPSLKVEDFELSRLTVRLLRTFQSISSAKESLIDIAADGIIDEYERPELEKIIQTLDEITLHAQELRAYIKKKSSN